MRTDTSGAPLPSTAADSSPQAIATRNLLSILVEGGPMMIPILGCSVLLLMFVFERAISLRRGRVIPRHFVKRFLHQLHDGQLKPEEALELCEQNRSPAAEVFAAAVKKWNRPSVEVEQAVLDAGERVANGLRRYLRLFNGISTISPLLGLLGTVLGMIHNFNAIAAADDLGRSEQLAAGISEALLTTAGGLFVAIPAFIAYIYFVGRVDRLVIDIDSLGHELVDVIAADAWQGKSKRKPKTTNRAA
jgi:biopolymer transport protein ExbB